MCVTIPFMPTEVMPHTTRIGVGFVGGGFMTKVHSQAARSAGAQLRGAASRSIEGARTAVAEYGLERAYDDLDALLAADDVDLVHVCSPNATHAAIALAALEAGKHVICEKPLALSSADAERMTALAAERGVVATVPFVYRFHPLVREARARVASGETGRVLTINGAYLQDWMLTAEDDDWRADAELGGPSRAFADIGSHLCDLIEFVTGDRIVRLAATKRTFIPDRLSNRAVANEDAAALVVETAGGAIGTLLVSQLAAGRKNRLTIEISGTTENLVFDQEQPELLWIGRRAGSVLLPRDADQLAPDAARLSIVPSGHPMGYQDAFNAFVADTYAAVAGAAPDGLPVFADGLRAVRLTEAVLASAESGAWVEVPA